MDCGLSLRRFFTGSTIVLLLLLDAALVWQHATSAPTTKRHDVISGSEFLSVFINGAMASPPQRRRGFRRGGAAGDAHRDSLTSESHQHEASIYRISRTGARATMTRLEKEEHPKIHFIPAVGRHQESKEISIKLRTDEGLGLPGNRSQQHPARGQQKVIGVSVTSTVEATPYKVRVEHHDHEETLEADAQPRATTEELSNIVSESNRSEFLVDEGSPKTWRGSTAGPSFGRASTESLRGNATQQVPKVAQEYPQPEKVYSEPARVYSEPAKVYSEPAKVYSEPARVYSEPARVYSEPEKVYSVPARVYSEPAKVYSEPAKLYDSQGRAIMGSGEPVEQNYEVDESVSVGSNGKIHGPQMVTESPSMGMGEAEPEDGHKIGYVVEGRNYRKYRVEERTPDGFIVGEYGVVSHDDGSLRGVRYTADGTINPRLIYDALMKFLAL